MFASYSLEDKSGGTYSIPKLNSKKSRLGCQRCKSRRVKCDEAKPKCQNCRRHGASCIYLGTKPRRQRPKAEHRTENHNHGISLICSSLSSDEPSESQERRLLEVRLMCHYVRSIAKTLGIDEFSRLVFTEKVPDLCFSNPAMIYAIYSLTALSPAFRSHDNAIVSPNIHLNYLAMALRHHRADLANIDRENVDAICMTSFLLRGYAFTLLQRRTLEPYTPPIEWLVFSRTTIAVFTESFQLIKDMPDSITHQFIKQVVEFPTPKDSVKQYNTLKYLLEREPGDIDAESWDEYIEEAYEWAVVYYCTLKAAVESELDQGRICRRLMIFPMFMPERLVELIRQEEPRSLAVLAHYFAFLASFEHIWWIGDVGLREIRAIAGKLSGRWSRMMQWPMQILEQKQAKG